MKQVNPVSAQGADKEIAALIETLHSTGRRLEELTAGEVDAVADRDGRMFLLRHAQEQLRDSEAAKQAAILDALPAHVALLDARGTIISTNEGWRRFANANGLMGPHYGIGINYLDVCDRARGEGAAEAGPVAAGIRSVMAGAANEFSAEYPCHSPTQQRWFLMTVTPLADDHPGGVVVMHMDLTAEKLSEQRYRLLFDKSIDAVMLTIPDGRILAANPSACHMFGWTSEEILQGGRSLLVDTSDPRLAVALEQRSLTGQFTGELTLLRKDGTSFPGEVSTSEFRDEGGQARTSMIVRDITERKRAEQRFSDLLEAAPDAMVIVNHDAEMVLVNAQAIRLFGWPREGLLGQKIDILVPERFRGKHPENRKGFFAQPRARSMGAGLDLFGLRRDGSEFPVEISLSPLETSKGTLAITAIRDITERKRLEQEKEQYFKFFMLSTNAMCIADPYGCFRQVNPAFAQMVGYSEKDLLTKPFLDFVVPEDRQATIDEMKLQVESRPTLHFENRYLRNDGTVINLSWTAYFDRHEGATYATAVDVTERKKADARIAFLNRVYAMLSGINTLIVRVRDRDELFSEACRVAVETGGFRMALIAIVDRSTKKIVPVASTGKEEELLTAIRTILSSSEDAPKTMVARAIREKKAVVSNDSQTDPRVLFGKKCIKSGVRSMAVLPLMVADEAIGIIALYAGETEFFQEEEMKLLTDLAGDIGFAIDHIGRQQRLDFMAYYDELTGLANRKLFLDRVTQYMRSAASGGHKLAVFLIDLERFKNINDSMGRAAGDALLRLVAESLTRNAAGDANLVARVGADQFALVMPEVKREGALVRLLEKWIEAFINQPFHLNDAVFRIAHKTGIALFPDDGADAETLFRNAEAALKQAKATGERYLFYTQQMNAGVAVRVTLENRLRQALDNNEFVLHYQPKVNLATGKMTGAEALIRWNDPRTGLVPPGRFIPILEETGLIYEVGRWALRQAIADYLRWRAAGLPAVRIAVNVSPMQLRHRGFIDEIGHAVAFDPQAADGLELEITESVIMEDIMHNIASLQAIRDMGISIAIDDFGTGFSSLSYLAKLPIDTLKIDRSFVIDMTAGPQGLALVATIIKLAHSLKLKVVAEGVETEEQRRLLHLLDCDEMQGFLFSKPLPAEIFEARYLTSAVQAAT